MFASDSKHLAVIDEDYSCTLFAHEHKLFDIKMEKEWQFVGKCRVHHAPIRSIAFGESKNE